MMHVNLIPGPRLARARIARRKRAWWRFVRVYAIIAVVCAGGTMVPMYAAGPTLDADLARITHKIDSTAEKRDELQKKVAALTQKVEAAKAVGEHPDWSLVLDTIARLRAEDIVLESAELTVLRQEAAAKPGEKTATAAETAASKAKPRETLVLKITGLSSAPGGVIKFIQRLEGLALFDRVSLKDTRAQPLGRMPATHFEIDMFLPNPTPGGA